MILNHAGSRIAVLVVAILAISAFFLALPGVDLWVSGLFYEAGRGFGLARDGGLAAFRRSGDLVVTLVAVGLAATLALKVALPARRSLVAPNLVLYLLAALGLGPGLLVNTLLKDHWGRPRPVMVDAFGGDHPYVAVWRISGECARNCSFVAGEASSAIWLVVALALVAPRRYRPTVTGAALVYAVLLSLNRIAFGGHFLSDVLLAFALTLLVMALLYRPMVEKPPEWLRPERLEGGLAAFGRRLRGGGAG